MSRVERNGFTLIELMIVVAIVGVLAVLAIYGVRRYIANAKSVEARASVGQIAKSACISYEKDNGSGTVIPLGIEGATAQRQLCTDAQNPVPDAITAIAGKKYQSAPSEWRTGSASASWACLSFQIDNPQYFQYDYTGRNIDVRTGTFSAKGHGDLNGDGVTSTFTLNGAVDLGQARTAPTMDEAAPEE
jgi:type IV pilus assembly protein PilA